MAARRGARGGWRVGGARRSRGGAPVRAQIGAGALAGRVVDQAGAAVPGATVTVTVGGTSLPRTAVTAADGGYTVPGLAPGHVPRARRVERVPAADPRGRPARHRRDGPAATSSCEVGAPDRGRHGHRRRAAAAQRDVRRSARSSTSRRSSTCRSTAAASSRSPSLAPGVALPPGSSLPRINGGRPRTNEYLFDGISVLQPEPGQVAFFPEHRRDPGVQDREQQPAGRVRPLQRRRRQPDDQVREQRVSRHASSSSSGTRR